MCVYLTICKVDILAHDQVLLLYLLGERDDDLATEGLAQNASLQWCESGN